MMTTTMHLGLAPTKTLRIIPHPRSLPTHPILSQPRYRRGPRASSGDADGDKPAPELPPRIITTPPPGRAFPSAPPPSPAGLSPDLKLQKVEKLGEASIEGVAKVERMDPSGSSTSTTSSITGALQLVAGDVIALLIFATIGRLNHHEGLSLATSFETALPFLIGWFVSAPFLGAFGEGARGGDVGAAVGVAAKSWAAAIPLGLVIRSVIRGYVPDKAFIIVSFVATAMLLVGWRAAKAVGTKQEKKPASRSKKGNPFEFLSLLTSLVRRW